MQVIAHRGASGYAPENTRAAFELAIAMGADAIETDVRLSFDGEPVLIHDATVTRTTDGRGPVADHTLAELRALDAGSWFSPEHAGERIPTLGELIAAIAPRIPLVLEIKDAAAAAPAIAAIRRAGIEDRVHVTSFLWPTVLEVRQLVPELPVVFLTPELDADIIRRCARRGISRIGANIETITPELVAEAHAAGIQVRAWGLSRREQVERLFVSGADGATVNWPDWMLDRRA